MEPFVPEKLPLRNIDWAALIEPLVAANRELGNLAAVKAMKEKPMHLNLLKVLHAVLMDSVRGQNQRPGQFRKDQNWIGPRGCTIEQAYFVPPEPSVMAGFLDNWEKYWHAEERDRLVQLAILHAQFEIIHPFRDGNGRIGRVLIPLFLTDKGLLDEPVFYLSEFLEAHRDEYTGGLRLISDSGSWTEWLLFFLNAIARQAVAIREKAERIIALYEAMKREVYQLGTTYSLPALDALFMLPVFTSTDFVRYSQIPKASASRLLNVLREKKLIDMLQEGQGRRPSAFIFQSLISITETPLMV